MLQFFYRCLLLQIDNLNLATSLENYCFYVMLIACKRTPLWKKLYCDIKNEPPYLANTLHYLSLKLVFVFHFKYVCVKEGET